MIKSKIKTKFLLVILGTSAVSLLAYGLITLLNMQQLGKQALRSNGELGATAAENSEEALKDQATYYLKRLAQDQAAITNTLFEKVETEVNMMSWYIGYLWDNSSSLTPKPSYYTDSNLTDPFAASVCKIAPDAEKDKVEGDIRISSRADDIFRSVYPNDPNLKSIYLGTKNGLHRRYPWTAKGKEGYDPRNRTWYQMAVKSGTIGWTDLYISASDELLMVTCYKPVYIREKELIGVIGADVTLTALNEQIINTQIGDLGTAFLIDKKGEVIASGDVSKGAQRWDENVQTEKLLKGGNKDLAEIVEKMIKGESGIGRCTLENSEKYIAYAPIAITNWSLGITMPVKEIIEPAVATKNEIVKLTKNIAEYTDNKIRIANKQMFLIFLCILMILAIVAIRLSKAVTSPIYTLTKGTKAFGEGKLDHRIAVSTGDELEDLALAFNKMADDLKTYIRDLKETTAAKEKIESELKIAREIQASFLPQIFPAFPGRNDFDIFATMEPAKEVAGDFYDFFLIDEKNLFFLIADVSGKGVPAALFMAIMKILLKTEALRKNPPAKILYDVNNIIARDNDSCMFATVFCAVLNTETGVVEFANAGHNPPLVYKKEKGYTFLEMDQGFLLGPVADTKFSSQKMTLAKNEIIFLYTDGVTEAMNSRKEQFSEKRLLEKLARLPGEKIDEIIHRLRHEVQDFVEKEPQSDDITMMAVQYKG